MDERSLDELYKLASENAYPKHEVYQLYSAGLSYHDIGFCIENNLDTSMVIALQHFTLRDKLLSVEQAAQNLIAAFGNLPNLNGEDED